MSLLITDENYNGASFPSNNLGDWISGEVELLHYVDYSSEFIQNSMNYTNENGVYFFQLNNGSDWYELGFADGKAITITTYTVTGVNTTSTVVNTTIDYLDGDKMFFTVAPTSLTGVGQVPINTSIQNPTPTNLLIYIDLYQDSAPEKINYDFNLTKTGQASLNSVVDGEINRFSSLNIGSMAVGSTINLNQVNNKSGGLIENVTLRFNSLINGKRKYTIKFDFIVWAFLQDGFSEPQWSNGIDSLGCINRIGMFSDYANPNSIIEVKSQNIQGNIGAFDENFNTGNDEFSLDNLVLKNLAGDTVDSIDYGLPTLFEAKIVAPAGQLDVTNSRFNIGLVWRPVNTSEYKNNNKNLGNNLSLLAPNIDFQHSTTPSPTVYNGYMNTTHNFNWSFSDLQFEIIGNTYVVSGKVTPNNVDNYFDTLTNGEKLITLWVSSKRVDLTPANRLSCSTKIYNADSESAPQLGEALKLQEFTTLDHGRVIINDTITTEDDVRLKFGLELLKNKIYDNFSLGLRMFNSTTNESFYLERFIFNFDNVPFINGVYQVNETIQRQFNLPPSNDRKEITFIIDNNFSDPSLYLTRINYAFLSDWRYWLANSNVDNDFYDITQPNNGLNKNWQRFSAEAGWQFQFEVLLEDADGVSDFFYKNYTIRPYEDEDITDTHTYVDTSTGATTTALINDTVMEVETLLTNNDGNYGINNFWAEVTIEDFESGNRWVLSSVSGWNNSSNPLKALFSSGLLDFQVSGNIATLKYKIDTSIINANAISISSRIFVI